MTRHHHHINWDPLHVFSPTSMRKIEHSLDDIGTGIKFVAKDSGKVLDAGANAAVKTLNTISSPIFTYLALGVAGVVVYYVVTSKSGSLKY